MQAGRGTTQGKACESGSQRCKRVGHTPHSRRSSSSWQGVWTGASSSCDIAGVGEVSDAQPVETAPSAYVRLDKCTLLAHHCITYTSCTELCCELVSVSAGHVQFPYAHNAPDLTLLRRTVDCPLGALLSSDCSQLRRRKAMLASWNVQRPCTHQLAQPMVAVCAK
jgi:hypothetical protein